MDDNLDYDKIESLVKQFMTFVVVFTVAAMSLLIGYQWGKSDASNVYLARCNAVRQVALQDKDHPAAIVRATVLTADFIEYGDDAKFCRDE